jgi:DNA-binding response OmpR family regulator
MPVGDVRGAEPRRQSGAGRLLLVDDDPLVRRSIARLLRGEGFEVLEVANAEEGWNLMQSQGFDVVLTDVCMPGMSGVDLLTALREDDSSVPIILITGKPSVDAAVECMKIGAFDYLTKPVQPAELLQRIRAALQQKQAAGENSAVMTAPGTRFSGYRVIRVLGEGSAGVVCQVEKKEGDTRREYALKILKVSGLNPGQVQSLRERFLREAEAASKVHHPQVIRFIEYGLTRHEEIPYMVMEYYPHPSLASLQQSPLNLSYGEKAKIIWQVASALEAIHEQGICHRDVKPGNVLLNLDTLHAKISDFGIAQLPDSHLTAASDLIGSPAYMAPEAFRHPRVDSRADIFSLGVVAYELFLGHRPFRGHGVPSLAMEIGTSRPTEPRKQDPQFPPDLQLILARMLKKERSHRYQSAAVVAEDLQQFLAGEKLKQGWWQQVVDTVAPDWC